MNHDRSQWEWRTFFALVITISVMEAAKAEYAPHGRAIPVENVKTLHFHKGKDTTYRRSSPMPQLRCLKGCEFEPGITLATFVQLDMPHHSVHWPYSVYERRHSSRISTTCFISGFNYLARKLNNNIVWHRSFFLKLKNPSLLWTDIPNDMNQILWFWPDLRQLPRAIQNFGNVRSFRWYKMRI